MLLKRLELSGFKSFAQKTTLEFTAPITAVVGPNGSGKSNIAEAIRFVLGEQSMKSLRSKRGEDLVFHGSGGARPAARASVAITFDNASRTFPVDYGEVEIKRTVHRDGTNYYSVNGSRQRLKDITDLLSAAAIGGSSHHIISQGEADRVLSVSIKERRGIVEDALGLRVYQNKQAESERKLAKTRENIAHIESLRREIAPHLAFLEKQVEKIRQAREYREALTELYTTYLAAERAHLDARSRDLQEARRDPEEELQSVEKSIQEKESQLREHEHTQKTEGERELQEKEHERARAASEREEATRQLGRVEGRLEFARTHAGGDTKEGEPTVSIPRAALSSFASRVRSLVSDVQGGASESSLEATLASLKEAAETFFSTYLSQQDSEREYAAERITQLEQEQRTLTERAEQAASREEKLAQRIAELRKESEERRGAERTLEQELFRLRGQKTELANVLEKIAFDEKRLEEERGQYKYEVSEAIRFVGKDAVPSDTDAPQEDAQPSHDPSADTANREEQAKRKRTIERYKIKIEDIGTGGEDTMREYEEMRERDEHLAREIEDMEQTAESLSRLISELSEKIDAQFREGLDKINTEFSNLFSLIFGGGTASLEITAGNKPSRGQGETEDADDTEEAEEGLDIAVDLPGKRIKGLRALSGGERALTSIALLFAMSQVNPPPFLVLDETDAALDESNAHKYGEMLSRLSAQTQFVLITHNRETMMRAGTLYGVTASKDGVSRILSVQLDEAEAINSQ